MTNFHDFQWQRMVMQDHTLSVAHRLVAVAIVACKSGRTGRCDPGNEYLAKMLGMKKDTIIAACRAMVEREWLRIESATGRGRKNNYSITWPAHLDATFNPSLQGDPFFEKGSLPRSLKGPSPPVERVPPHPSALYSEQTEEQTKRTDSSAAPTASDLFDQVQPQPQPKPSDRFEEFWALCPKPVDRPATRKAWTAALKKVSADVIIAGIQRYADHCRRNGTEFGFIKTSAPWLNGERWSQPLESSQPQQRPGGPRIVTDGII